MLLRASLAGSIVLVVGVLGGGGCGGAVAPVIGGDGGASGSSGGSGSSSGGNDAGPVVDSSAPRDSALTPDTSTPGPCQPDGVPCSFDSQCCTQVCSGGVCGGPTTSCIADGSGCQSSMDCCSGLCSGSVCEEPAPPSCAVSSNANQCDVCLAESCCSQLSSCEAVTACAESQMCFDSCYAGPGTGAKCAETCAMEHPSTQGDALEQCAVTSCLSDCD